MHSAHDVQTCFKRFNKRWHPGLRDEAAGIGDADHQRASAFVGRVRRPHLREPHADLRAGKRELPDAKFRRPVAKTKCRLRETGLDRVAKKKQIWLR